MRGRREGARYNLAFTFMEASMRLTAAANGMYVISATPFTDAGALDLDSTASLMDF